MTVLAPPFGPIPAAPPPQLAPGVLVSRRCACRTPVVASRLDPTPGVREHNRTEAHRWWWARARADWQGEP